MKLLLEDEEITEILPTKQESAVRIVQPTKLGRNGKENLTEVEKTLIALEANTGSSITDTEVGKIFGVKQQTVSRLSEAIDRTQIEGRKEDKELKSLINQQKYKIADKATSKLMDSLDLFNPNQLEQKDLPGAASKMASIVEKVSQNFGGESNGTNVNFLIYAPRIRSEDSYEVIEVNE